MKIIYDIVERALASILPSLRAPSVLITTEGIVINNFHCNDEERRAFKDSAKNYRKGGGSTGSVSFSEHRGKMRYIHHGEGVDYIDEGDRERGETEYLYILFRHDNFIYEGSSLQEYEDCYIPPVYICVQIDKREGGERNVGGLVGCRWKARNRSFPHMGEDNKYVCLGHNETPILAALMEEQLDVFMDLMSHYLQNGINPADDWGENFKYFKEHVTCDTHVDIPATLTHVPIKAYMAGIAYADRQAPFPEWKDNTTLFVAPCENDEFMQGYADFKDVI